MEISREEVIASIRNRFERDPSVFAFWLEGADSLGTVDEYSDIDVWLDVEDGKEEDTFAALCQSLREIGELDICQEQENPDPKIRQRFYHIEGSSKFLLIDVCIQSHSREISFTNGFEGEKVMPIFDKAGVIKFRDIDQSDFTQALDNRLNELEDAFTVRKIWVDKELRRERFLEAFGYYMEIVELLIEALRIRHSPTKHDFGFKHLSRDLPKEIVDRLSNLVKADSLEELERNLWCAGEMFQVAVGR